MSTLWLTDDAAVADEVRIAAALTRGIHIRIPWWYAPYCVGFDVVVGIYLLVAF
ncbi:MAG: hypothetical protein J2P32_05660 [Actinobacteria bacterium]|nr:hypothetical protein [Actinomycetota bacterium]